MANKKTAPKKTATKKVAKKPVAKKSSLLTKEFSPKNSFLILLLTSVIIVAIFLINLY